MAIGRKNWTFCGSSDKGGRQAAGFYTLIDNCKLCEFDPPSLARPCATQPAQPSRKENRRLPIMELEGRTPGGKQSRPGSLTSRNGAFPYRNGSFRMDTKLRQSAGWSSPCASACWHVPGPPRRDQSRQPTFQNQFPLIRRRVIGDLPAMSHPSEPVRKVNHGQRPLARPNKPD